MLNEIAKEQLSLTTAVHTLVYNELDMEKVTFKFPILKLELKLNTFVMIAIIVTQVCLKAYNGDTVCIPFTLSYQNACLHEVGVYQGL